MALGERLFRSATPACNACHSVAPGVNMAGPSLAGIGERATKTIGSGDYKGKAKDPRAYVHEAIVEPSAHVVPGAMYSANGVSFMPNTYGQSLKPELVVEVLYDQVTGQRFRHGTKLLRKRPDKAPRQCTMAQLSHPLPPAEVAQLLQPSKG